MVTSYARVGQASHAKPRRCGDTTFGRSTPAGSPAGRPRALAALRIALLTVAGSLLAGGCSPDAEMPVVAQGKYIELATDRDAPICGGTIAFMDDYLRAVAAILGEELPDARFVRYQWREDADGLTSGRPDAIRVATRELAHEHELVHAVHFQVWPATRPFFYEGLAVLLDNTGYQWFTWPDSASLDALLEADSREDFNYHSAWFLVSQLVREHGMSGLREFWSSVPPTATSVEIRSTYERLFGQSIDVLLEPIIMFEGEEFEFEVTRATCSFAVCVGQSIDWEGDEWTAPAADDCEDDAEAVGPSARSPFSPVWRPYVVDLEASAYELRTSSDVGAQYKPCELQCTVQTGSDYGAVGPGDQLLSDPFPWPGPVRFEVGREVGNLPSAEAGALRITRLAP